MIFHINDESYCRIGWGGISIFCRGYFGQKKVLEGALLSAADVNNCTIEKYRIAQTFINPL
jgi:hypothetical protein